MCSAESRPKAAPMAGAASQGVRNSLAELAFKCSQPSSKCLWRTYSEDTDGTLQQGPSLPGAQLASPARPDGEPRRCKGGGLGSTLHAWWH